MSTTDALKPCSESAKMEIANMKRADTGSLERNLTKRMLKWYACKRKPFHWISLGTYQVSHWTFTSSQIGC